MKRVPIFGMDLVAGETRLRRRIGAGRMTWLARLTRTVAALTVAALTSGWSFAGTDAADGWKPSGVFAQAGAGQQVTSGAMGLSWDWSWHRDTAAGRITGTTDVLLGEWRAHEPGRSFTQAGVTPSLRLYPHRWDDGWFVEGGIGANAISPDYENRGKRFSTEFNFGDHVGIGRRFGPSMEHELSLRVEHFSNCGISHPNPGENWIELRYTRRF